MKQMNTLYQYTLLETANIGENVGTWVLEQVFWIGMVVYIVGLIWLYSKKAYLAMGIAAVAGAILLFLINNPTIAVNLGGSIMRALGFA